MNRKHLLGCGIAASILYVAMNVLVPMRWQAYSSASQTVSELSAIGAPTRPLWVVLGVAYGLLMAAFGAGVWASAGRSRALRLAGATIIANAVLGFAWPPMHLRETLAAGGGTLTDTLHIAWTMMWGLLALVQMCLAAAALGRTFRIFTLLAVVVIMVCGYMAGLDGPRVSANLPTPWVGVWERINIGAYLLWVVVLASNLRRTLPEVLDGPDASVRKRVEAT
jgi:hypothetical protein